MPCSDKHFIPILDEIAQRPGPDDQQPEPPSMARIAGRTWGGRRPGAGAPKGNLNALRHGKYSARHRHLAHLFAQIPEVTETLVAIGRRRQRRERLAEAGASEILAGLFQRAGQFALHPEDNQAGVNQELLEFLRTIETGLRSLSKTQSREAAKIQRSIKKDEANWDQTGKRPG